MEGLENTSWDLIIVGGGITGMGILREALRNGLKALLLEQKDFGWGTSSRSSKMVHGGLRYLKTGNLALTMESVRERENLIKELPGLVDDSKFLYPLYNTSKVQMAIIQVGLFLYDLMARKFRKRFCSSKSLLKAVPSLKKDQLSGGFILNDAITDDARLVFRVLTEAVNDGGLALNYCKVTKLLKEKGKVTGAVIRDQEKGTEYRLNTRLVINATGTWVDKLRAQVKRKNNMKIRALRGSHLIFSSETLPMPDNVLFNHPKDNRPLISLNWEGRTLVGTTDLDHKEDLDKEAGISREEVDYLLSAIKYQFPQYEIKEEQIIATISGVRSVIDSGKANPSQESRDHAIWQEEGLISVTGGKLTTFRSMATDVLKLAQKQLGPLKQIKVKRPIFSGSQQVVNNSGSIDENQRKRIQGRYGALGNEILAMAKEDELRVIFGTKTLWAELRWALKYESVIHLEDLMLRRTRLGLLLEKGGEEILPWVKQICIEELKWDKEKCDQEERDYLKLWRQSYSVPL